MKTLPLNRAHVKGAVALHRATRPWCYRGKTARSVLRAFYDAYANRDFTVGTVALEEEGVAGVMCGATDPAGPARWLRRRRRWRSLRPRLVGGADMALGGWDAVTLARAAEGLERPSYLVAAATAEELTEDGLAALSDAFAAATASRGATHIVAPSAAPDERLAIAGFETVKADIAGEGFALYVRKL
ncbi:MAG TPA: hypothetical protein VMX79_08595 [bacterium]|nr:hypothetical protein [bacterium]